MSLASWLVAGMIPGVNREPLKKIVPNPEVLLQLLHRWRDEAIKAGKEITRISRMRPGETVFGWPVGRGLAALMPMSPVWRYHTDNDELRRLGSIRQGRNRGVL